MSERGPAGERDRATDRAASAARALAAVADNAARNYVKRDAVAPQPDGPDPGVMAWMRNPAAWAAQFGVTVEVDSAERERQARLRRWQMPPNPTRRDA